MLYIISSKMAECFAVVSKRNVYAIAAVDFYEFCSFLLGNVHLQSLIADSCHRSKVTRI